MANVIVMGKDKKNLPTELYELEEGGVGSYFEGAGEKRWRYQVLPDPTNPGRATSLGSGGFGAVVAAEDRLGVRRAIKFFLPLEGARRVLAPYGGDHEKRVSNKRRFKHVVDAFDSGKEVDATGKEYEYAVSPLIDGYNLGQMRKLYLDNREKITASPLLRRRAHDDAISIINDLAAAIHEMHTADLVHMDIKPPNVRVSPQTFNPVDEAQDIQLESFLIDLGASRDINLITGNAPVPATYTVDVFPLHFMRDLEDGKKAFSADALRRLWRYIDLYCCGRTLEVMFLDRVKNRFHHYLAEHQQRLRHIAILEGDYTAEDLDHIHGPEEQRKEEFWSQILGDDFEVLRAIIQKLLVQEPEKGFQSSEQLLRAVQALPRLRDRGILSSSTLTDPYPRVKIRTGNELVRFSPPYDEIIEHPIFQRLRRVQQLSFVSDIFPDGTHTRFSHSIRTFEMAKRFVWGLSRRSAFRSLFQRPNVDCLLASALLHDIGQYHFSHCLEDLHKMGKKGKGIPALVAIEHDQVLAPKMLTDDRFGDPIEKILARAGISLEDVRYIIQKEINNSPDPVLSISRDIVSGIIDVDRVSYLTQDSERTGVPYGRALDVETLAEALTIRWDAKEFYEKGAKYSTLGLAIEAGGISAAEAVLAATYWMYRNVYWRHTNRAFMAAVKFAMRHVLMHTEKTFTNYIDDTWGDTDIGALRWIRKEFQPLRASMNLADPLENLDLLRRISYKRVFSLPYLPVNDAPLRRVHKDALLLAASRDEKWFQGSILQLQEQLSQAVDHMMRNDDIWRRSKLYREFIRQASPELEDKLAEHITKTFLSKHEVRKGDVLIDIPLKSRLDDLEPSVDSAGESQSEAGPKKATISIALRSPITRRIVEWRDLKEYSRLAGEFGRAEAYNGRKVRVFFASALAAALSEQEKERIENEMFDTLYDLVV